MSYCFNKRTRRVRELNFDGTMTFFENPLILYSLEAMFPFYRNITQSLSLSSSFDVKYTKYLTYSLIIRKPQEELVITTTFDPDPTHAGYHTEVHSGYFRYCDTYESEESQQAHLRNVIAEFVFRK